MFTFGHCPKVFLVCLGLLTPSQWDPPTHTLFKTILIWLLNKILQNQSKTCDIGVDHIGENDDEEDDEVDEDEEEVRC